MQNVLVLGSGLVGKVMARDLAADFNVTVADRNEKALEGLQEDGIATLCTNLADAENLQRILPPFDLVVGALPGFLGFETVRTVIEAGKSMVDISFFPEDPFELDELAHKHQVTVVTDCGVAPGMGNMLLGYHNARMKIHSYTCLVGGLPVVRQWPWQYRAVFSPADVIEEYVRPARFVQNGALVVREALTDPELIDFEGIGTLEAWNTDGLRTLLRTMRHIPNMIEKTLRYPGSMEYMRVLRHAGYFSAEETEVNGMRIRPIDLTARLLFRQWQLKPGEEEFTVMRIVIEGQENGTDKKVQYDLLDRTDRQTGTLSMARTTGYTCTAVAHLVASGQFSRVGVCPPEYLGESESNVEFVLNYLKARNVKYAMLTHS
ncbi:MAG: saccharopine dehydrogenase [Cyclobacteriaceae bacterium]|nr:MAG: saccharopine dehydrogenase [Cyclobacteriaceae bacterium]